MSSRSTAPTFEHEQAVCRAWFQDGLTREDRDWLRVQLELAGERIPTHDTSWLQMQWIR